MDKFEREARARPRHHQPIPSQYRTWWGHGPEVRGKGGCGLVVGRGEKIYLQLLPKPLLGGMSCWDDRPPKRGNLRGNRWVHALRVERESINTVAGIQGNKTNPPMSGEGGSRTVLVVDKYFQTRQRRLRGKTVKHYPRQAL